MNSLAEIIRAETAQRGVLPFERFMELALYHPRLGYYETQKHSPGRRGDFYTSVSTGELFGQLLACQFASWLEELKFPPASPVTRHPSLCLIEAGAHDGKLAGDILKWLQLKRPKLFNQIEYLILEPSPRRQEWQRETLKNFAPRVRWFSDFQELAKQDTARLAIPHSALRTPHLSGIIFSNELLDAFPVHRFGWDARQNMVRVGSDRRGRKIDLGQAGEFRIPSSEFRIGSRSSRRLHYRNFARRRKLVARSRRRSGARQTAAIDYGFTADEMFSPARTGERFARISATTPPTTFWRIPAARTSPPMSIFPRFARRAKTPD